MSRTNIDIKVIDAINDIELVSKRICALMKCLSGEYFDYRYADGRIEFELAECYYRMIEEYFYTLRDRIQELQNLDMKKAAR